jgi:short-subunit dehydrogenase
MFLPSLERHRGGVLNVGSMAGFLPGPGMAVYYASKSYVRSFTDSLQREWKKRGVRVTNLAPGPVPTEFGERAGVQFDAPPQLLTQTPEAVAEAGYSGLMRGQRVVVPGAANKLVTLLARVLPRRLLLRLVGSRQSRRRAAQQA